MNRRGIEPLEVLVVLAILSVVGILGVHLFKISFGPVKVATVMVDDKYVETRVTRDEDGFSRKSTEYYILANGGAEIRVMQRPVFHQIRPGKKHEIFYREGVFGGWYICGIKSIQGDGKAEIDL